MQTKTRVTPASTAQKRVSSARFSLLFVLILFSIGVAVSFVYFYSNQVFKGATGSINPIHHMYEARLEPGVAQVDVPSDILLNLDNAVNIRKQSSVESSPAEVFPPPRQLFVRQWRLDLAGHNTQNASGFVYPLRWLNPENEIVERQRAVNYNFIVLATRYDASTGEFVLLTTMHYYEFKLIGIHHDKLTESFDIRDLVSVSISAQFIYNLSEKTIVSMPTTCKVQFSTAINEFYCQWPGFPSTPPPENLTIQVSYHGPTSDYEDIARQRVDGKFVKRRYAQSMKSLLGRLSYPKLWSLNLTITSQLDPITTVAFCSAPLYSPHYAKSMDKFLNYHLFMGVERFTIYDRYGDYYDAVKPYIAAGIVEYERIGNLGFKNKISPYYDQIYMLEVCRYSYYASSSWVGIWDFDEYLIAPVDTRHVFFNKTADDPLTTNPPGSTNLFPSNCIKYNAVSDIFDFNYDELDLEQIDESLRARPYKFRPSPMRQFADPNNYLSFKIDSGQEYLQNIGGHCRSLLSDFFVQQSIRSNRVDVFLENVPVGMIQFLDKNEITDGGRNYGSFDISYPEQFCCLTCEEEYRLDQIRLDPFKSFYPPQSESHFDIHTLPMDSNKFKLHHGMVRFRAVEGDSGPLPTDQLFFAHYRNAVRMRTDPKNTTLTTTTFWQEGSRVMKLIKKMKADAHAALK